MAVVKRATKGTALTYTEMDENFQTLLDRDDFLLDRDYTNNEVVNNWTFTNWDPNVYDSAANTLTLSAMQITTTGGDIEIFAQINTNILSNTLNATNEGRRIISAISLGSLAGNSAKIGNDFLAHFHDFVPSINGLLMVRTSGLFPGTYDITLQIYGLNWPVDATDLQHGNGFMIAREVKSGTWE